MPEFRFRAAAALELRRQQERHAAAEFARADGALREARGRLTQAEADRRAAAEALVAEQCRGTDIGTLAWHRNWIVRCGDAVARLARDVQLRALALERAEHAWREARQRLLALERMRERAWRRHLETAQRLELKQLDEVARLRHVLADAADDGRERSGE
jgi:flagellar export protein FliJ